MWPVRMLPALDGGSKKRQQSSIFNVQHCCLDGDGWNLRDMHTFLIRSASARSTLSMSGRI